MQLYQVRVDIYEGDASYPIVVHLFHAATRGRAYEIHDAHRKADRFLRECEDSGVYAGRVKCHSRLTEGWVSQP